MIQSRKREHSRKPDEQYKIIEDCSWGPRIELFSRGRRRGWTVRGNQAEDSYAPDWATYGYDSAMSEAAEQGMVTDHLVPADIVGLYEVHEWRNAAGVLKHCLSG